MKKVSIVVPTFNQGQVLPMTLDWVFQQSYPNLEVIVVDGGSQDGTKDFLENLPDRIANSRADFLSSVEISLEGEPQFQRQYGPRYPQEGRDLKIVTFPKDIGATETINEGFSRVTGEYCTYVVGDDLPHLSMVEEMVGTLESTGADFAYADMAVVDDAGSILQVLRKPEYSFEACFAQWFHIGVARLYRSELHRRFGHFDPAYAVANDYDMYLRFAIEGAAFVHVPKVLYSVRFHGKNRKTGQHTSARQKRLFEESVACARRARNWQKELNAVEVSP